MADGVDASAGEEWNPQEEESWQAFAAGAFADVVPADSLPVHEDDEWCTRNPMHHVVDMLIHRYGDVNGRSSPAEFWWGWLVFVAVAIVLALKYESDGILRIVLGGWLLLGSIAVITAAIRRLHDSGRSGARLLFWLLPGGAFYVIYALSGGGEQGQNRYGQARVKYIGPLGQKIYRR